MSSIWSETTQIAPRKALEGNLETEAVVIGGGMAGVLIAYELQKRGVQTVILEGDRLGGGQTKNTTAKVTSQHDLKYQKLIEDFGEEKAGQYARMNQRAIAAYRALIAEKQIDCDWEERPAYLYSTADDLLLREEAHAAWRLGIDAKFTTAVTLPFPVKGAVRFDGQAQFHPLKFLSAVAEELTVYEHTPVIKVEGNTLYTDHGTVTAAHIIFATHFPFVNMPGYYFLRMHQERSYVLALENAQALDGMYLGVDEGGLSLRNSGGLLLLGGGGHRTGENEAGGKYSLLREAAKRNWRSSREVAHWSAQDCIPLDGVPYIGRFSPSTSDWYVATGFQKWGMTSSMASAMVIAGLITGREDPDGAVFAPHRFEPTASAKNLWEEGKQAVTGLSKGAIDLVSGAAPRCPHLGCELKWNPDEESWDCPCHGSRFDADGILIDGPAQKNMKGGSD